MQRFLSNAVAQLSQIRVRVRPQDEFVQRMKDLRAADREARRLPAVIERRPEGETRAPSPRYAVFFYLGFLLGFLGFRV